MSPQQAADFLGISRQHMTRLLDAGVLPFTAEAGFETQGDSLPSRC